MSASIGSNQPVAVVTGASAGVGRAVALELARHGYRLGLLARGRHGVEQAAAEAVGLGTTAVAIVCDVSDAEAVEAAAVRVEAELGPIDVWVNVAFASVFARSWEIEPAEYERVTKVSYLGFVYGTLSALRRMRPRDRGVIIQVGSALAYRGIPLQAAYCGAKHAIQGFNESLRCELLAEHSGVRTVMVQLPGVNTPQFSWVRSKLDKVPQPVPPIYQPEVVARAVHHAIEHPRRRERWVGGSTAATLMANAVVPGLLDRYLARTGVTSQLTDQAVDDHPLSKQGNLDEPADRDRDFGSHGAFDDKAKRWSLQQVIARLTG
ncbi:SDR family oxidoreductase [Nocardioides terrisoli]|uniref:SDR family oxidoreductase n=1 Tax=Nocardioides terrisoli TaxID=3388267 RepID=UPI00287B5B95|nr:SDR family oxidoreductase [Nocardioides marmorisolisilvae]